MIKGKRGGIHADWIISMGFFLISVIFIIAFLKPGIVPFTKEKVTLDLLIENFDENFMWNVKVTPFFIEECTNVSSGGDSLDITGGVIRDLYVDSKFGILDFITGFASHSRTVGTPRTSIECDDGLDNDDDGAIDWDGGLNGEPADFSCGGPNDDDETLPMAECQDGIDNIVTGIRVRDGLVDLDDPGCSGTQDNIEANLPIPDDRTRITISLQNNWEFSKFIYTDSTLTEPWWAPREASNEIIFYCVDRSTSGGNGNGDMLFYIEPSHNAKFLFTYNNARDTLPDGPLLDYECDSNDCSRFISRFGTAEELIGINLGRLNGFKLEGGDPMWQNIVDVKATFEVPPNNEFWIQGWRESDSDVCGDINSPNCPFIVNYKTADPTEVDNVKVEEVKSFILTRVGSLEDIRLFYRVW